MNGDRCRGRVDALMRRRGDTFVIDFHRRSANGRGLGGPIEAGSCNVKGAEAEIQRYADSTRVKNRLTELETLRGSGRGVVGDS